MGVGEADTFILGLHALKDMATQHLGIHQQLNGIVNSRATDAETVGIDDLLQLLDCEVTTDVQDMAQDGIALGCLAHTMSIQVITELSYYGIVAGCKIFNIWIGFHRCDKSTTNFGIKQSFVLIKQIKTHALSLSVNDFFQCQLIDGINGEVAQ